jgi:hypothetical protein
VGLDKKILLLTTILIAATLATVLFSGYIGKSSEPNMGPVDESLDFENCVATKIDGNLNVSLAMSCVIGGGKTVTVNEFKVDMVSQHDIAELAIHINGTLIDSMKTPVCVLKNGDLLQVYLILPRHKQRIYR